MQEVKKISPEKFDAMLERIMHNGHPLDGWYPNMAQAEEIVQDPINHYEFIIWILESNPDRELTEEQQSVEKFLQEKLKEYTQFI